MSWVKLDDQFPQHPKLVEAGPLGLSLFVAGLCYCSRYLTDGFIPRQAVGTLLDFSGIWSDLVSSMGEANAKQIASVLVGVGLWDASENGYLVHDYLAYNPSKEQVLATREARSEAGKEGGLKSGQARRQAQRSKIEAKPKQNASKSEPRTRTPSPLSLVSNETKEGATPSKGNPRETSYPEGFVVTEKMKAKARAKYPGLDIETATEKWERSMRANRKRYRYTDWALAWLNAMGNAEQWGTQPKGNSNGTNRPASGKQGVIERVTAELTREAIALDEEVDSPIRIGDGQNSIRRLGPPGN